MVFFFIHYIIAISFYTTSVIGSDNAGIIFVILNVLLRMNTMHFAVKNIIS
jgi:predicted amino acid-binding ACT domain protein